MPNTAMEDMSTCSYIRSWIASGAYEAIRMVTLTLVGTMDVAQDG
jgi:hypothetical protein